MIRCPWHCWEFDIRTGQSLCDPNSVQARAFDVAVEPGKTLVEGPFVAEVGAGDGRGKLRRRHLVTPVGVRA